MAGYELFFIYGFVFPRTFALCQTAAIFASLVAIGCAVMDYCCWLGEPTITGALFGQETLALAILALFMLIAHSNFILLRMLAMAVLALSAGGNDPLSIQYPRLDAGAILLYALVGLATVSQQSRTLKRAGACVFLLVLMAAGYGVVRHSSQGVSEKVSSWSPQIYKDLWALLSEHARA